MSKPINERQLMEQLHFDIERNFIDLDTGETELAASDEIIRTRAKHALADIQSTLKQAGYKIVKDE